LGGFVWLSWVIDAICLGCGRSLQLFFVSNTEASAAIFIAWLSPWLQWSAVWFGFENLGESLV
jgi:hypothetical protein